MHRIKINPGVNPKLVLLSYYNSITFAFTEICGRSYGGGVLEILPKEMGEIEIPKLDGFDEEKCDVLLNKIDAVIRAGGEIETVLDMVDKEVMINYLKIDAQWCKDCRLIWKKMQKRRLGRG